MTHDEDELDKILDNIQSEWEIYATESGLTPREELKQALNAYYKDLFLSTPDLTDKQKLWIEKQL